MKSFLKALAGLLIGIAAGLLIASVAMVLFTDHSFSSFFGKLFGMDFKEILLAITTGIVAFFLSLLILIPLHEVGHLLGGWLTGYKFTSFRIFNFIFLKEDGKLKVKKYSIPGTGGQCLMTPPDIPLEEIPTTLYNFGGVAANLIALAVGVILFVMTDAPLAKEVLAIFIMTDLIMIIMNGVPMKVGGLGNDAYNMLCIRKERNVKRIFVTQLRSNALIQAGTMPEDLPSEWFERRKYIDYSNPFEVSEALMRASVYINNLDDTKAKELLEDLFNHRDSMAPVFHMEVRCALLTVLPNFSYTRDHIRELLTPETEAYIEESRKYISTRERTLFQLSANYFRDKVKAEEILENLKKNRDRYVLQGEVNADLRYMEDFMDAIHELENDPDYTL